MRNRKSMKQKSDSLKKLIRLRKSDKSDKDKERRYKSPIIGMK